MRTVDGSYGEGGGQLVRSALVLSVLTGRALRIEKIRAGRDRPGLRPQHLTAVRALAAISDAETEGAELESRTLVFRPRTVPTPGSYSFDVAEAAPNGSAGSAVLILQSLLLPLALAGGSSRLTLRGGTHVRWSPSFHYLDEVYLPVLRRMGVQARARLEKWGFYPAGGGETIAEIDPSEGFSAIELLERGALTEIRGVAVASNLPAHIPQRMTDRARALLESRLGRPQIEPLRVTGAGRGAGIFLTAEYEHTTAGFAALGKKGKPSEEVAEEAVDRLLTFHGAGGVVDRHLGDQLLLPAALAGGITTYRTERVSSHLLTVRLLIESLTDANVEVTADAGRPAFVRVKGCEVPSVSG